MAQLKTGNGTTSLSDKPHVMACAFHTVECKQLHIAVVLTRSYCLREYQSVQRKWHWLKDVIIASENVLLL